MPRYTDAPGKIYVLNLPSGDDLTELHIKGDFDTASFAPHGISIYTDDGIRSFICIELYEFLNPTSYMKSTVL